MVNIISGRELKLLLKRRRISSIEISQVSELNKYQYPGAAADFTA